MPPQSEERLTQALQKHFGHQSFRPQQREIITSIIQGNPTLAILPTGGGKSLTYQLPALLLDGVTLVISPLLSLIKDQTHALEQKGIAVGKLDSTLSNSEKRDQLARLERGEVKLFYTSPESLAQPQLKKILQQLAIALVAVDEAHCISEWGHSFRPAYLYLPKIIRQLKARSFLALTATATRKTASEIRKAFRVKVANQFSTSHRRPNLHYCIIPCLAEDKKQQLLRAFSEEGRVPAVVYVMRQQDCEDVAYFLSQNGFTARSYHAGMNYNARSRVQDSFLDDKIDIVVATIAFGMGVDKPNIRSVIHYHLPKSPEGWLQESGRAGRDGLDAQCLLLACGDDLIPLNNFIHTKQMSHATIKSLLTNIFNQAPLAQLSPYHTRLQHDIQSSTLEVLLARLEITGLLRYLDSSWRYIRAWPLTGHQLTVTSFSKKIQLALLHIFAQDERYDTFRSEQEFGVSTKRLWQALYQLRDSNDLYFKPSGWLWNYRVPKHKMTVDEVIHSFYQTHLEQAQQESSKLEEVKRIATSRSCIPRQLSLWLGEKGTSDCGHCSSCLSHKRPKKLPTSHVGSLSKSDLVLIHTMANSEHPRFRSNRQLSHFLCGIPSPYIRHFRLYSKSAYGKLSSFSYDEVLAQVRVTLNAHD